jgi:hypothetical protein
MSFIEDAACSRWYFYRYDRRSTIFLAEPIGIELTNFSGPYIIGRNQKQKSEENKIHAF